MYFKFNLKQNKAKHKTHNKLGQLKAPQISHEQIIEVFLEKNQ